MKNFMNTLCASSSQLPSQKEYRKSTLSRRKIFMHRFLFFILILTLGGVLFFFDLHTYLNFEFLKDHHETLKTWTATHYMLASLLFILFYIGAVTLSLPGATFLTLAGGFLFGIYWGTLYVLIGATLGATLLCMIVQFGLKNSIVGRSNKWVIKMRQGFKQDAFQYLLILRLVPLFPFWAVNIVAGVLKVPLTTFFWATAIGILPGTVVYILIGNGLDHIFATNATPNLAMIFEWPILLPLLGLAGLSLASVAYKQYRRKKGEMV